MEVGFRDANVHVLELKELNGGKYDAQILIPIDISIKIIIQELLIVPFTFFNEYLMDSPLAQTKYLTFADIYIRKTANTFVGLVCKQISRDHPPRIFSKSLHAVSILQLKLCFI